MHSVASRLHRPKRLSQDLHLSFILGLPASIVVTRSGALIHRAPEILRNCILLETLRTREVQYDFVL
jgi:hypothetical protein